MRINFSTAKDRVYIEGLNDPGKTVESFLIRGIKGYGRFWGAIAACFGFALRIEDAHGNIYFVNKKSLIEFCERNGKKVDAKASNALLRIALESLALKKTTLRLPNENEAPLVPPNENERPTVRMASVCEEMLRTFDLDRELRLASIPFKKDDSGKIIQLYDYPTTGEGNMLQEPLQAIEECTRKPFENPIKTLSRIDAAVLAIELYHAAAQYQTFGKDRSTLALGSQELITHISILRDTSPLLINLIQALSVYAATGDINHHFTKVQAEGQGSSTQPDNVKQTFERATNSAQGITTSYYAKTFRESDLYGEPEKGWTKEKAQATKESLAQKLSQIDRYLKGLLAMETAPPTQ